MLDPLISRLRIGARSAATASRPVRGGPRENRSRNVRISRSKFRLSASYISSRLSSK
jgi:hypothetical protein